MKRIIIFHFWSDLDGSEFNKVQEIIVHKFGDNVLNIILNNEQMEKTRSMLVDQEIRMLSVVDEDLLIKNLPTGNNDERSFRA